MKADKLNDFLQLQTTALEKIKNRIQKLDNHLVYLSKLTDTSKNVAKE